MAWGFGDGWNSVAEGIEADAGAEVHALVYVASRGHVAIGVSEAAVATAVVLGLGSYLHSKASSLRYRYSYTWI
jgi:hypothetical protein